jgi:hypothetical protein
MECELPEFYSISEPVARAQRGCCECRAPIRRGEKYVRCTGKWFGDPPQTYSQHVLCAEICEFIRDEMRGGDCIAFGGMKEWRGDDGRDMDRDNDMVRNLRSMYARMLRRERAES